LSPNEYRAHATRLLSPLLRPTKTSSPSSAPTLVYPLSQLAPLSTTDEDSLSTERTGVGYVLDILAQRAFQGGKWVFTAGYFNPSEGVKKGLIQGKSATGIVINASAEVPHLIIQTYIRQTDSLILLIRLDISLMHT
jgi:CDP-diacylglycerol---glycerol-3-phosphate 3-phosphatidyltransferase